MRETIAIHVDGRRIDVERGVSVAAALLAAGIFATRRSVTGEPRGPVCAMGICFECRVTIDGRPHCLACQTACVSGMEVKTVGI